MLDSFTELIPGHSKKQLTIIICTNMSIKYGCDMIMKWSRRQTSLATFRVNLAFFRHVQTSTAVQFDLDFATIKQSRVKRSVTFSLPTGNELPEKLPKLYGSKSGQKVFVQSLLQSLQLL